MLGSLLDALDEVHAGELDPRQASAMASLAGAITKAYGVGVLEERLTALETAQGGRGERVNFPDAGKVSAVAHAHGEALTRAVPSLPG